MNSIRFSFFVVAFVMTPLSAAMALEQLPTITVTANRTPFDVEKTMASVSVIERDEIETKQYQSVPELLSRLPGISITNSGGVGQPTGVSIRGTNSNAVLVLIDGQRLGSATLGQTAFEHLPIDQIERVEVVRGPRSSLYGADAIGGVIQIFTRKASEDGVKPFVSIGYGSHESYQANAGVHIKQGNSWGTLSVAGNKTQGIDATLASTETDRDGHEDYSASLKAGHRFNDRLSVDANVLHVKGKTEYDNSFSTDPYNRTEQNVYGLGLNYSVLDMWDAQFKLGRSEDRSQTFSDKKSTSKYNTTKDTFSWLNTLRITPDHQVLVGFDYLNDKVTSKDEIDGKQRDNYGYFAQYLGQFGQFNLQTSLRLDDNEQFGNHTTGNVSVGYQFSDALMAYASYGTAFKTPTFNDLYSPYGGVITLDPESSKNYELGFKGQVQKIDWSLTGFYNEIEDLIVWRPDSPGSYNWYASQVDQARIRGVELNLGQTLDQFTWNMNYTYQDPENRGSGEDRGKQINYRAKQLFNLSADYRIDDWSLGGSVHAEDQRYTNSMNTGRLAGFATADVRVGYHVNPEFSIQAKLANMFDAQYQTNEGYRQDGRTAWVTLRYAMK